MIRLYQNGQVKMILSDKIAAEFEHEFLIHLVDEQDVPDVILRYVGQFCLAYINAQLIIIGCQQWSIMQRN